MTTSPPEQQLLEDLANLRTRISALEEGVRLTEIREAVADLQTTVLGMPQLLASLRQRGYVFERDLEGQTANLTQQWNALFPALTSQMDSQTAGLASALQSLEEQAAQAAAQVNNPASARPLVSALQASVSTLEDKVTAAKSSTEGLYEPFSRQVASTAQHMNDIEWMLTQLSEASFQLLPTEGGIAAVKAVWCKSGKEQKGDPLGVLFLTDQRLLFEKKEEVATKKVLFVATEKQKVQELQLEVPLTLVAQVETSKQGLLKNEDHIEIHLAHGAPVDQAHLHIWQENAAWQALINRARTGDFAAGRAVAIDQAALDKVKAAPSQCPSCGGNLTQPVLRGQDSLTCEYCGFVIRL